MPVKLHNKDCIDSNTYQHITKRNTYLIALQAMGNYEKDEYHQFHLK